MHRRYCRYCHPIRMYLHLIICLTLTLNPTLTLIGTTVDEDTIGALGINGLGGHGLGGHGADHVEDRAGDHLGDGETATSDHLGRVDSKPVPDNGDVVPAPSSVDGAFEGERPITSALNAFGGS